MGASGRVALGAGEDHVLLAVAAGGLQDDVHVDLLLGQHPEDLKAHARLVGDVQDRNDGDVGVFGDTLDQHTFHIFCNLLDHSAGHRVQAGEHLQLHIVFLGQLQLYAAVVQHLGAQARQLEHLVKGDLGQLAGVAHLAGVGGVDAFHIGVDLAPVGVQGGRDGHRAGVRAAAPQGGDVVQLVDSSSDAMRSTSIRLMRALV